MTRAQGHATESIPAGGWARIAARTLAMLLLVVICVPLYYLFRPFTRHNPAPRAFMAGISRIAGLRITVEGERVRKGAFLIPNHVSWLDIPALTAVSGTAFVAHDGLSDHGWLRWLAGMNDTVFIARHDRASVARQVEQVREAIRDTGSLTVFPEGTTADGRDLLPFKSSLLSAITPVPEGISVQPVLLDYGSEAPDIAWVGDEPGQDNYLRIASRRRPITVTVHFLPPLSADSLGERKAIAAAAREAVLQAKRASEERRGQRVAL